MATVTRVAVDTAEQSHVGGVRRYGAVDKALGLPGIGELEAQIRHGAGVSLVPVIVARLVQFSAATRLMNSGVYLCTL